MSATAGEQTRPGAAQWYLDPARLEDDIREHSRVAVAGYADLVAPGTITCSAEAVGLLRTIHALETATLEWLRIILVSPTHSDAQVTAFLCTWAYERHWVADALAQVVVDHGGVVTDARSRGQWRSEAWQRIAPIGEAVWTNLIGDDVVAAHLVEAAIGEALGLVVLRRLGEREPGLEPLCRAIRATKQVHLNYFRTRAAADLAASSRAQRLVRLRLRRFRWPTAGPAVARTDLDALVDALLTPADCRDEVGALLAALPGSERVRVGLLRHRIILDVGSRS